MDAQALADQLLDGLSKGERSAISRALNLVDDQRPDRREAALCLLDALERGGEGSGALRVGLTGAPGAGKSTLMNALVEELRRRNRTVGIVAVDPSSQRSGGALLGDRMRLGAQAREPGVFLRSMAARDRLGGLADATWASVSILSACFDSVFVETVGVGQSEAEVAALVDTLVFVAQPGAGDMLQFMKAGLMELPDVFAVNKADQGPAAERTRGELLSGLDLSRDTAAKEDRWSAPVLLTSAAERTGIGELVDAIDAHRATLEASGRLAAGRARSREALVLGALARRYGSFGIDRIGGARAIAERVQQAPGRSAVRLLDEIGLEIERRLAEESR